MTPTQLRGHATDSSIRTEYSGSGMHTKNRNSSMMSSEEESSERSSQVERLHRVKIKFDVDYIVNELGCTSLKVHRDEKLLD